MKPTTAMRTLLLGVALLASGGCTTPHLTGSLMGRPFIARGAYAESIPGNQLYIYATQYEGDVLENKTIGDGEAVLVVLVPELTSGKLPAQGQRTSAQVAFWKFSRWSPAGQRDWRYGNGSVEVVARSLTKIRLRVDASFQRGDAVSGELIVSVRSKRRPSGDK